MVVNAGQFHLKRDTDLYIYECVHTLEYIFYRFKSHIQDLFKFFSKSAFGTHVRSTKPFHDKQRRTVIRAAKPSRALSRRRPTAKGSEARALGSRPRGFRETDFFVTAFWLMARLPVVGEVKTYLKNFSINYVFSRN